MMIDDIVIVLNPDKVHRNLSKKSNGVDLVKQRNYYLVKVKCQRPEIVTMRINPGME